MAFKSKCNWADEHVDVVVEPSLDKNEDQQKTQPKKEIEGRLIYCQVRQNESKLEKQKNSHHQQNEEDDEDDHDTDGEIFIAENNCNSDEPLHDDDDHDDDIPKKKPNKKAKAKKVMKEPLKKPSQPVQQKVVVPLFLKFSSLPSSMQKSDFLSMIHSYGPFKFVKVVCERDNASGSIYWTENQQTICKGVAYVEFLTFQEMERCKAEMQGFIMSGGAKLGISYAPHFVKGNQSYQKPQQPSSQQQPSNQQQLQHPSYQQPPNQSYHQHQVQHIQQPPNQLYHQPPFQNTQHSQYHQNQHNGNTSSKPFPYHYSYPSMLPSIPSFPSAHSIPSSPSFISYPSFTSPTSAPQHSLMYPISTPNYSFTHPPHPSHSTKVPHTQLHLEDSQVIDLFRDLMNFLPPQTERKKFF